MSHKQFETVHFHCTGTLSVCIKLNELNIYHKLELKIVHKPLHFQIFNVARKGKKLHDISFRCSQGDIADFNSPNLHTEQNSCIYMQNTDQEVSHYLQNDAQIHFYY